jgi:hypothetical protein
MTHCSLRYDVSLTCDREMPKELAYKTTYKRVCTAGLIFGQYVRLDKYSDSMYGWTNIRTVCAAGLIFGQYVRLD